MTISIPRYVPSIGTSRFHMHTDYPGATISVARDSYSNPVYFAKLADGEVVVISRHEMSFDSMSESCRRAYCALSGIPYNQARKHAMTRAQKEAAERRKRDIEWVKDRAKRLGLTVAPAKKKAA